MCCYFQVTVKHSPKKYLAERSSKIRSEAILFQWESVKLTSNIFVIKNCSFCIELTAKVK